MRKLSHRKSWWLAQRLPGSSVLELRWECRRPDPASYRECTVPEASADFAAYTFQDQSEPVSPVTLFTTYSLWAGPQRLLWKAASQLLSLLSVPCSVYCRPLQQTEPWPGWGRNISFPVLCGLQKPGSGGLFQSWPWHADSHLVAGPVWLSLLPFCNAQPFPFFGQHLLLFFPFFLFLFLPSWSPL